MAPDGRTEGRTDGHGQTYIPPPSVGNNYLRPYFNKPYSSRIIIVSKQGQTGQAILQFLERSNRMLLSVSFALIRIIIRTNV